MGIAPYKYFTYDGESSRDYDVYLTGDGVFNAPERAVEMVEIPGRNGNYALDQGKFNNITVTYKAGIVDVSESDFANKVSAVRNWLCSKVGYKRLSDDYNPNEYRMAVYKSGVNIDHVDLKTGEFEITFDCKPQRWLTSGETAVTIGEWGETETVSGEIVEVEATETDAVKSLVADINPIQDLHGYDAPWVGGAGKNKLNYDAWKTTSIKGGTAVWENNGVSLTATENDCYTQQSSFPTDARIPISEGETITLTWEADSNLAGNVYIFPNGTTTGLVGMNNANGKSLSYTATSGITFITFRFGVQVSGNTIKYKNIMARKSGGSTWQPYSNICPISGHDEVGVSVVGKNLLPPYEGKTVSGITYAVDDNGVVTVSGTSTAANVSTNYWLDADLVKKLAGQTVTLSGGGSSSVYLQLRLVASTTTYQTTANSGKKTFTIPADVTQIRADINVPTNGTTIPSGTVFYPQLEFGSTATEYEPYNGQSYTTTLPETVYGGTLDLVSGVLTVDRAMVNANTKTWTATTSGSYNAAYAIFNDKLLGTQYVAISNKYVCRVFSNNNRIVVYADNMTSAEIISDLQSGEVQICYYLATPTTYQLTPQQIELLLGTNNIWADSGDITLEYGQNPSVLINPTPFDAEPLLAVDGYGTIGFNGYEVEIENVPIGDITLYNGGQWNAVVLDESNLNVGDTIKVNAKMLSPFIETVLTQSMAYHGVTNVSITCSGSGYTATFGSHGTISSTDHLFYIDIIPTPFTLVSGTNSTITNNVSGSFQVRGHPNGFILTFSFTQTYTYNASTHTLTYNISNISVSSSVDWCTPTLKRGMASYYSIIGDSTKSAISDTVYIDCDIGECWTIQNGSIVSLNGVISLGSDLPKLSSGANTFNYDNTVTQLEVQPRWWKV